MLLIKNGRVVDPANDIDDHLNILINKGTIVEVFNSEFKKQRGGDKARIIDAKGMLVFPGIFDSHVHFNEPGREDWEGFETGTSDDAVGQG